MSGDTSPATVALVAGGFGRDPARTARAVADPARTAA
ncbi:hypothetical protein SAMN04488546_2883 [Geodermatophilus poikilotrophus]|uniref:Uncharacterized protein n=1 Tax=Geodermatophilus poikilotrophus TaxID=1333667 RepID=A0A1I0FPL2_9ACTN|nr:hypothetical protein SAMN04488546_2883 [Geodermatophilus poikilotrophus]